MTGAEPVRVARKPWFLAIVRRYVRQRLSKSFEGVWASGMQNVEAALGEPVIIAANHVAWWDAFLIVLLDEALGTESYCLMDEANLQRYPFFGWIGAVPLDRASPRHALRDLRSAATLLDRPRRLLWIFPQGRQRAAHLRPLQLEHGVRKLAEWSHAPVVPLSINYPFRESPWPAAFVRFAPILDSTGKSGLSMAALEAGIIEGLSEIDELCDEGVDPVTAGFEQLLTGRGGGPETRFSGRLLAAGTTATSEPESERG